MTRKSSKQITFLVLFGLAISLPASVVAQDRDMSRQDVLNALENGVIALRTIDRPDQADQLLKTLRDYANLAKDRPDRERKERAASERENLIPKRYRELSEEKIAARTIAVMRYAMEGLIKANKERLAELMEHAIHARELRLERADGEEAAEIMKSAPNRANETELLLYAAKLLDEQRKGEKAMVVREMGEWFQATLQRNREREQRQKREGRAERSRDRETQREHERAGERERDREARSTEGLLHQVKQQQEAINELAHQLERLAESNEKLQLQLNRTHERREQKDK